jgi:uncharacterized membrane protein
MLWYDVLRWVHVLGATVLLGTGAGIAFFMVMAHRTKDAVLIAHVAGTVVVADTIFTASAVLVQPISGYLLAREVGWDLTEPWLLMSIGLYVFTGGFWLPVVWMQARMRNLARTAAGTGTPLPAEYFSLYRLWFVCGFPAFAAVLGIVWLMLTRPQFG